MYNSHTKSLKFTWELNVPHHFKKGNSAHEIIKSKKAQVEQEHALSIQVRFFLAIKTVYN
jgi:hypothetical protein